MGSDFHDGGGFEVDEVDVIQVEGFVVVLVEARPLGAVGVSFRAERLGGGGGFDDGADLVAEELAERFVRFPVDEEVGVGGVERAQRAHLPERLVALLALLRGGLHGGLRGLLQGQET